MICTANQLTGFYMWATLALNGLKPGAPVRLLLLLFICVLLGCTRAVSIALSRGQLHKSDVNFCNSFNF